MAQVATRLHGTWWWRARARYVFQLPDGRRVTGQELLTRAHWPWRDSLQLPGMRYARLTATSPTYGPVTVVIVEEPGEERTTCFARRRPSRRPV